MTAELSVANVEHSRVLSRARVRDAAVILLLGCLCFTYKLGQAPLAGTEGHRAITAHQMVQSGEYLVPKLYGYTYLRKPPLAYWVLAGFEKVLGENELAWRLPSALSAAAMAAFLCFMTARWFDRTAGLVAGIAAIGLIPLWGQNRSADIDAMNTLATVGTAVCLIEMWWHRPRRPAMWAVLGGVFFGAALLVKLTGCLPVVLGTIIGSVVFNRSSRAVKSVWTYLVLGMGLVIVGAWALAVAMRVQRGEVVPDTGGVDEAVSRLFLSLKNAPMAIATPGLALLYALPSSLALILPLNRELRGKFKEEQQAILLALGGAVVMAMGIGIVAGIYHERYTYPALPLLAPLVGASVYGWRRGLGEWWDGLMAKLLVIVPAAFLIAGGILTYRSGKRHGLDGAWFLVAPATVIAAAWTLYQAMKKNALRASTGLVVMMALLSMMWGEYMNRERFKWSAYTAAATLRKNVGKGGTVTTWYTLWAQPELFYYAKVNVKVNKQAMRWGPFSGWMVYYDDPEWMKLKPSEKDQLSEPIALPIDLRGRSESHVAYLVKPKETAAK